VKHLRNLLSTLSQHSHKLMSSGRWLGGPNGAPLPLDQQAYKQAQDMHAVVVCGEGIYPWTCCTAPDMVPEHVWWGLCGRQGLHNTLQCCQVVGCMQNRSTCMSLMWIITAGNVGCRNRECVYQNYCLAPELSTRSLQLVETEDMSRKVANCLWQTTTIS
jgi:hypothetical protein